MNPLEQELHQRNLPELMRQNSKEPVETPAQWERRRQEIGEILSREFAGFPTRLACRSQGSGADRQRQLWGKGRDTVLRTEDPV